MESKSDIVWAKTGERLNLVKFQITFSVSPSFFIVSMNEIERNSFRVFFARCPPHPTSFWGDYLIV